AARAFCREVTQNSPANYDPAVNGCFTGDPAGSGLLLYWSNTCVSYDVQQDTTSGISLDAATKAADDAFAVWSATSCGSAGPDIHGVNKGPVECGLVEYNKVKGNQNVIVFQESWPNTDMANTLGLTTLTFDINSGEIYDADIQINATKP